MLMIFPICLLVYSYNYVIRMLIQEYNYNVIPYESRTQTATIRISCIMYVLKYYIVLSF